MNRQYQILDPKGNVLLQGVREDVVAYLSQVLLMCLNFNLTVRDLPDVSD